MFIGLKPIFNIFVMKKDSSFLKPEFFWGPQVDTYTYDIDCHKRNTTKMISFASLSTLSKILQLD